MHVYSANKINVGGTVLQACTSNIFESIPDGLIIWGWTEGMSTDDEDASDDDRSSIDG